MTDETGSSADDRQPQATPASGGPVAGPSLGWTPGPPSAPASGFPVPSGAPTPAVPPAAWQPPGGAPPTAAGMVTPPPAFPVPAPPPREAWRPPRRVEPVPGTPFGVAFLDVPPVTSALAVGALVAGIAALLVALVVGCFGVAGAGAGWGAWVAGAFAVLGVLLGAAGTGLGVAGRRQTRPPVPPEVARFAGRGLATAGLWCGVSGLAVTLLALGLALLLQLA